MKYTFHTTHFRSALYHVAQNEDQKITFSKLNNEDNFGTGVKITLKVSNSKRILPVAKIA